MASLYDIGARYAALMEKMENAEGDEALHSPLGEDLLHPPGGDEGEPRAVRDIKVGAERVLDGVHGPARIPRSVGEDAVASPTAHVHQFAPGAIVVGLREGEFDVLHQRAERRYHDAVVKEGMRRSEELLEDVIDGVRRAAGSLPWGHAVGVFGVQEGHRGIDVGRVEGALILEGGIGYHRACVVLATRRREGQDIHDGESGLCLVLPRDQGPAVAVVLSASGDGFGAIEH